MQTVGRIGIIGGGVSGLCMARALRDAGASNIVIFEREDAVGGKSSTMAEGETQIEMGTCYATTAHKQVRRWMKEQGTRYRRVARTKVDGSDYMKFLNGGEGANFPAQIVRYLKLRKLALARLEAGGFAGPAAEEMSMSCTDWLALHKLGKMQRLMLRVMTSLGYGFLDTTPILHAFRWVDRDTLLSGSLSWLYMPRQGWTAFWNQLAAPFDVRTRTEVVRAERQDGFVNLHLADGSVETFDLIVVAIPLDDFVKVCAPTPAETFVAGSVDWMGYATSLVGADSWFEDVDVRAFPASYRTEEIQGVVTSARYEGFNADGNEHLYVVGQIPGTLEPDELRTIVLSDVEKYGAVNPRVILLKRWKYFARYRPEAIRNGLLKVMQEMQGKNRTYYTGSLFSHESVANICALNTKLVPAILADAGQLSGSVTNVPDDKGGGESGAPKGVAAN